MLCIELARNGERVATAGIRGKGLLFLTFDRELGDPDGPEEAPTFSLDAVDATTEPNSSLNWAAGSIATGDEFVVRFITCDAADEPKHRRLHRAQSRAETRRRRLRYLRHLEAEAKKVRAELGLEKPKRPKPGRGKRLAPAKRSL